MFCIENNEKNKSAVILNPERSEWVSRSHVTSVESVVNDGVKTKRYSAKRDLYARSPNGSRLKMTALAFLLSLNLSTSYAGECLPGECQTRFTSCTCNDNGKLIEGIQSDGVTYKYVNTYDGAGHQTSRVNYSSAEAISTNTPDSKYEYTYDSAGHKTSQVNYNSAEAISTNTPDSKTVYASNGNKIYIESGNILYVILKNGWKFDCIPPNYCPSLDTTIVCAYGYTEGCVAEEVTLADGSKVMMKNGQEISESGCYTQGKVFWDNACVDEYPFAKKHWTPAEASKWLHDGNDNFVVITFKK